MKKDSIKFGSGFKYPFKRAAGLLNILWALIPIIGWFALYGYCINIVKHFIKGDFKQLPKFDFSNNIGLGFFMFFKSIPFFIVLTIAYIVVGIIPFLGVLGNMFIAIFIAPILIINFYNKETVASLFEFSKLEGVFNNMGEYVIAVLKTLALRIIFGIMILVLVGIPAGIFARNIFLSDFYRKYVK